MASSAALQIILKAQDMTAGALSGVKGKLSDIGHTAGQVGKAVFTGLGVASGAIFTLAASTADVELVQRAFGRLSESIGETADTMLAELRPATRGMMSDSDLMSAANKLMAMGLADSAEKAAEMAHMATTLGLAMGEDAGPALENFTLMLANQSIPRLDTFGISSGQVRTRMAELMEATADMTREEAFMIATMEAGKISLEKLGDMSGSTAETMGGLRATMENLKDQAGLALLPVLNALLVPLLDLATQAGPMLIPIIERLVEWFTNLEGPVQTVIAAVMGASAVFAGLGGAAVILGPLIGGIGTVLAALTGPIGIVIAAVALLAVAWATDFGGIRDKTAEVWEAVQGYIQTAIDFIQPYVEAFVSTVRGWFDENWPAIQAKVEEVWAAIQAVTDTVVGEVSGFIQEQFGVVVAWVQENWPLIQLTIETVLGAIQTVVETVLGVIRAFWESHGEAILTVVTNAWNAIKLVVETVIGTVLDIIKAVMLAIQGDWEGAWEIVKGAGERIWAMILTIVETAITNIKTILASVLGATSTEWSDIWEAMKTKAGEIWDTIKAWAQEKFEAIKTVVTNAVEGMKTAAIEKWEEMKTAAAEKWVEILTSVQTFLEDIKTKISGFSLFQAGVDMIQGFIGGMGSMIGAIGAKARELAQRAWDAVRGFFQSGSPSRLMMEEGRWFVEGFLVGVDAKSLEAKQKAAEAFSGIVQAAIKAMEGLKEISGYEGSGTGLAGAVASLAEEMVIVAREMGRMASTIAEDVVKSAKAFAEKMGPVIGIIQKGVEGLVHLSEWVPGDRIIKQAHALAARLVTVAREMGHMANTIAPEIVDGAKAFAEKLSPIIDIIQKGVEGLVHLSEWVPGDRIIEQAHALAARLVTVAREMGQMANTIAPEIVDAAKAFAEKMGPVVDIIQKGVEGLVHLAEWVPGDSIQEQVHALAARLVTVAREMGQMANTIAPEIVDSAKSFAEKLGPIIDIIKPGIEAIKALGEAALEIDEAKIRLFAEKIGLIAATLNEALASVVLASDGTDAMAVKFERWEARLKPLASLVKSAFDILDGMAREVPESMYANIQSLAYTVQTISSEFNRWLGAITLAEGETDAVAEKFKAWSDRLKPLETLIKSAFAILDGMAQSVPEAIYANIQGLAYTVQTISSEFNRWLGAITLAEGETDAVAEKFKAWSDRLKPLETLIKSTIEMINAMALEISWDKINLNNIEGMVAVIEFLANEFDRLLTPITLAEDAVDAMAEKFKLWQARLQPLTSVIKSTVEVINAMALEISWDKVNLNNIEGMVAVIEFLANEFDRLLTPITLAEDAVDAVAEKFKLWQARLQPLTSVIKSTVEVINAMALEISWDKVNLNGIQGMVAIVEFLANEFDRLLDPITLAEGATDAMAEKFRLWQARLQPLTALVKGTFDILTAMAQEAITEVNTAAIAGMVSLIETITSEFNRWFAAITLAEGETDSVADKFKAWAARISPLTTLAKGVTDLLTTLSGDFATAVNSADIKALVTATLKIVEQFDLWLPAITLAEGQTDSVMTKFTAWAARLTPLKTLISSTVGILKSLAEDIKVKVNEAKLRDIITAMVQITDTFKEWLPDIDLAQGQTDALVEKLGGWSARLTEVHTLVKAVLGIVADVAGFSGLPKWRVDLFRKATVDIGEALIGGLVEGLGDKMSDWGDALDSVLGRLDTFSSDAGEVLAGLQTAVATKAKDIAAAFRDGLLPSIPTNADEVVDVWRELLEAGQSVLSDLSALVTTKAGETAAAFQAGLFPAILQTASALTVALAELGNAVRVLLGYISGLFAFPGVNFAALGASAGGGFVNGIISGINSRLPALEAVLAYLAGLFPSSPAKHGPFRKLPDWSSLATGLDRALGGINTQLGGLTPALAVSPSGAMPMAGGGGGVEVHIHVGAMLGNEYEAQQFAREISKYLTREGLRG